MAKKITNNIKTGIFALAGLLFLVILLYLIGKNRSLFGATYTLKARFDNVQGLVAGNNVRFAGIEAGTVKKIQILSDTVIEITMTIDKKMLEVIHENAIVSIGTEGLVGNKVVNIMPAKQPAALATEGDLLTTKKGVSTDEMLETLQKTNNDIAAIATELKATVQRINNSSALWALMNDMSIPGNLKQSMANIHAATSRAAGTVDQLYTIVADVKNGKGNAGILLRDSSIAENMNEAMVKLKTVGERADSLTIELNKMVAGIHQDINSTKGTVNVLLKDTLMAQKLNQALDNIQKGTDGFNQNMEALKHNFLFRSYFRKLEKQKKKQQ
jgi:phospholipid/cholesterol/gamma-HCH transport system substrate-binding protein